MNVINEQNLWFWCVVALVAIVIAFVETKH
jgi:hypothetical protein